LFLVFFFFFQAEDGIRDKLVTGVQTCALPISSPRRALVPDNTLDDRIAAAKARLGEDVVILGHHYQRDEVIKFADFRGDSLKLSFQAAEAYSRYIVFCGVHFMAESADILRRPHQVVVLPDLNAGCSMADMADIGQVEACWRELASVVDVSKIVPVTYMNSTA